MRTRIMMLLATLFWLAGWAGPLAGTASAQGTGADFAIANGHFYTQANGQGGNGGNGFAITNDGGVPFWTEFQRLGGVNSLGYPVSGRFMWDGFLDQATQRVVMQWRPDTHQVLFVNTYDRLHDLGKDPWLQAYRNTPPPVSTTPDTGLTFAQVEARHLAFLNSDPAIKAKYYATATIGDPIVYNGLPMGPVTPEGPFTMLRCQRITIQHWLVNDPAAGAHAGDVDVTLGGDDAKASGVLPDKTALMPTAPTTVLTVTPPTSGTGSTSAFGYGFQAHMIDNGQVFPALDKISGAGFTWVKQQVEWKYVQPSSATDQNWGQIDQIVNAANSRGIKVMLSIVQAPLWERANPLQPYPKSPADLATFLGTMAARYKGKVGAYEVWNEENFAREVGSSNLNAGNYVELLKASFTAIRAADPNAIVVSGAPTPTGVNPPVAINDNTYLQQMYAYQGGIVKNYFDVLGAHAEAWANPPQNNINSTPPAGVSGYDNDPSFFFRRLEDYRNDMVAAGDGSKKIWETEFGYDSCQGANIPAPTGYEYCKWVSEQQQATYEVGAFNYARTNYPWLGAMFIWNLNFQANVPSSDEKWGFSVLRSDFTPRPAYTALAAMPKN